MFQFIFKTAPQRKVVRKRPVNSSAQKPATQTVQKPTASTSLDLSSMMKKNENNPQITEIILNFMEKVENLLKKYPRQEQESQFKKYREKIIETLKGEITPSKIQNLKENLDNFVATLEETLSRQKPVTSLNTNNLEKIVRLEDLEARMTNLEKKTAEGNKEENCSPDKDDDDLIKKNQEMQVKIESLQNSIDSIKAKIENLQSSTDSIKIQIKTLENKGTNSIPFNQIVDRISVLENYNKELEVILADLKQIMNDSEIKDLKKQIEALFEQLRKIQALLQKSSGKQKGDRW